MMLKEKSTINQGIIGNGHIEPALRNNDFKAGLLVCALLSFLAGSVRLYGSGIPLCVSFISVLNPMQGLSAFMGCIVSFFLNGKINSSITEITAMTAVLVIKSLFLGVLKKPLSAVRLSVMSGIIYLLSGTVVSLCLKFDFAVFFAIAFRAILCGIAVYFIISVISDFNSEGKIVISGSDSLAVCIVYMFLVCALCTVGCGYFNLGRAVGAFAVLAICSKYGSALGSAAGAVTSFGILLSSYDLGKSSVILICAGLLAGFVSGCGRLKTSIVFILSNLLGAVIIGIPSGSLNLLTDIIFASVVFVLLPENLYLKYIGKCTQKYAGGLKLFSDRLMFAASAIYDVRDTAVKASLALDRRDSKNDISEAVCFKVCKTCRNNAFCGLDDKHRTENYFLPAKKILESTGYLSEDNLPKILENCSKKNELISAFNSAYRATRMEKHCYNASDSMRSVAFEHLSASAEMLKSLSSEHAKFYYSDDFLSEKVKKYLISIGAENVSAAVMIDNENRIFIECFYEKKLNISLDKAAEKISDIADRIFDKPELSCSGEISKLCFHEIYSFSAEVGQYRKNGREDISGDSDNIFYDGFGKMYFILSDGMGSGGRAAVESCMAVSLLTKMLKSGLGYDAALKMINILLMTKSSDEIFATIDLCCVNLFTGKTDIIKLGAAQTFVKTGGIVMNIESSSLPVGILSSVEYEKRSAVLSDDDSFVMITDGIDEVCYSRVKELMLSSGISSQRTAEEIADYAESKCINKMTADDKTIFVVKLHKI